MKTSEALKALSGREHSQPLAGMRDQLIAKAKLHESARLADAQRRTALNNGAGPLLSVLRKRIAENAAARLVNDPAPAITSADLHSILKTASEAARGDAGLKRASHHAYRLWAKSPMGSLSVGDVARLRAHYAEQYPRSKVASVIDSEVPKVGFNTLPVPQLTRIAAHVQRAGGSQQAYEEAMVTFGLDNNSPHTFRCRAFVRSLLEGIAPEEQTKTADLADRVSSRLATDDDPILRRFAQHLEIEHDHTDDEPPMDGEPVDFAMDEEAGVGETIESPITGEPMQLQLSVETEDGDDFMDGGDEYGGPLPEGMEVMGQLEDFAEEATVLMEDPTDPQGGQLEVTVRPVEDVETMVEDDVETMVEDEEPIDAPALADDPMGLSATAQLQPLPLPPAPADRGAEERRPDRSMDPVTVRSSTNGKMTLEREMSRGEARRLARDERLVPSYGPDGKPTYSGTVKKTMTVTDANGKQIVARKFNVFASVNGKLSREPVDSFFVDGGMSAALQRIAGFGVRGQIHGDAGTLSNEAYIALDNGNFLHIVASEHTELDGKEEAFTPDVNEQMPDSMPSVSEDIMIGDQVMGSQAHPFEHLASAVVEGKIAKRAGWELQVNADAEVELTYQGKSQKTTGLSDLDDTVREFVAMSAPVPRVAPQVKYAAHRNTETGAYVVVTDVPRDDDPRTLKYNAQRMLKAIQRVVPATGVLRKDAKLQLEFQANNAALGRVRRILEDQYRAKEFAIEGQMLDMPPSPGSAAEEGLTQPSATPLTNPQNAAAPMGTAPAVADPQAQPAQSGAAYVGPPQQQMVQPPAGQQPGVAPRAAFVVHFTTPDGEQHQTPVNSRTASGAKNLFERLNDDCRVIKVAQMEIEEEIDVMPGDPVGGDEMAPLPVEDQLGGDPMMPAADPMMQGQGLSQEELDGMRAALTHFRNQGLGPAGGIDALLSQYSELFDRFGEKTSPERHDAEAQALAMSAEIWSQPAILEKAAQKSAVEEVFINTPTHKDRVAAKRIIAKLGARTYDRESNKKRLHVLIEGLDRAELSRLAKRLSEAGLQHEMRRFAQFDPSVNTQQPNAVSVPSDLGADSETDDSVTDAVEAPKVNQYVRMQDQAGTSASPGDLGRDSETKDPGSFGAPKPKPHPDRQPQSGESFSNTDLGRDSETDENITRRHFEGPASHSQGQDRSGSRRRGK